MERSVAALYERRLLGNRLFRDRSEGPFHPGVEGGDRRPSVWMLALWNLVYRIVGLGVKQRLSIFGLHGVEIEIVYVAFDDLVEIHHH